MNTDDFFALRVGELSLAYVAKISLLLFCGFLLNYPSALFTFSSKANLFLKKTAPFGGKGQEI